MEEKELLLIWNNLRKNFVYSQIIPAVLFIVLINLASNGKLTGLSNSVKGFILGTVGIIGLLSFINQYSSIREAMSLIKDINLLKKKSDLAKKISHSQQHLNLTATGITAFSLISYALLIWVLFS